MTLPGRGGRSTRTASRPEEDRDAGGLFAAARETVLVVAVALVVTLVVKTFLLQAFFIPSGSMEQTLDVGDRVVVSKLTPGPLSLHRGDVVVFADPGDWLEGVTPTPRGPVAQVVAKVLMFVGLIPQDSNEHLVKRVIGLPGDHVSADGQGPLMVNGTPVDESAYLAAGILPSQESFDVTVPAGELWVMGDNRPNSCDSRCHVTEPGGGFVPIDLVVGRAVVVVWPVHHWTWLGTPDDFAGVGGVAGVS